MSAIWTPPTDPTAGDPATAGFMRVNVTQNLRKLREDVDAITSGAVVKVGYKDIASQSTWGAAEDIVTAQFTPDGSGDVLMVEANYSLKQVAEANFLDMDLRNFKSVLEHRAVGASSWVKAAEYLYEHQTDPDSSLRTWSELVHLRAVLPAPAGAVEFRVRHTAYSSAGGWVAQDGAGVFVVMEMIGTAL